MAKQPYITQEYLLSILDYDPETGNLYWKRRPIESFATSRAYGLWNTRFANKIAGSKTMTGYISVRLKNRGYQAHILIWIMLNGDSYEGEIDHVNGNRDDNRICNLRIANDTTNAQNKKCRSDSKTSIKGVSKRPCGWVPRIQIGKKRICLGTFNCPAVASFAYQIAADVYFGEFARPF